MPPIRRSHFLDVFQNVCVEMLLVELSRAKLGQFPFDRSVLGLSIVEHSAHPSQHLIAVAVAQVSEIPHSAGLDGLREERVRHRDDFCHSVGASVSLCQFDDFSRLMNEGLGEVIKSRAEKWRRKTQFRLAIAEPGALAARPPDPRKAKLVKEQGGKRHDFESNRCDGGWLFNETDAAGGVGDCFEPSPVDCCELDLQGGPFPRAPNLNCILLYAAAQASWTSLSRRFPTGGAH